MTIDVVGMYAMETCWLLVGTYDELRTWFKPQARPRVVMTGPQRQSLMGKQ